MIRETFIYALIHPNTAEVRYIGKTIVDLEKRLGQHISAARCVEGEKYNTYKSTWIRSLLKSDMKPALRILEIVASDQDWQEREQWWIRFGRAMDWHLTNGTDGGDGTVGYIFTSEHRAKISIALTGRKRKPFSEEHRAKMSAANVGRVVSEGTRAKMSAAKMGHIVSEETRAKISAAVRGERRPQAKLTEDDVREIRRIYATGNWTYAQLAKRFNVGITTICDVVRRKAWKHI